LAGVAFTAVRKVQLMLCTPVRVRTRNAAGGTDGARGGGGGSGCGGGGGGMV